MIFKNLEYISYMNNKEFNKVENREKFIKTLKDEGVFHSHYDDDVWLFSDEHRKGIRKSFTFKDLDISKDRTIALKNWLLTMALTSSVQTCSNYYIDLKKAINNSKCFDANSFDSFSEWLEGDALSNNTKISVINSSISFIDFIDKDIAPGYMALLLNLKSKLRHKRNSRILPESKYVLQFSFILEDYLKDINKENISTNRELKKRFIFYYPIKMWWELTSIIPMRTTEFMILARDCIYENEKGHFIKVTRIKGKNRKQEYKINKYMYNVIKFYIDETEKYGETETLVSFKSFYEFDYNNARQRQKKDDKQFNSGVFLKLLKKFYEEVVEDVYSLPIESSNRLKPNDTRHIAFISLMLQNISPVEIARFGGHSTIKTQYEYSYHTEYWIDHEVFKLMSNFKGSNSFTAFNDHSISKNVKLHAFKQPTSDFQGELGIGYCSDSFQRCESHDCTACSHWRINREDLVNKNEQIIKKMKVLRDETNELIPFIIDINRILIGKEVDDFMSVDNRKQTLINKVKSNVHTLASLTLITEKEQERYD